MAGSITRKATYDNINAFLTKAQEETDETADEIPAEEEVGDAEPVAEDVPAEEAPVEEEAPSDDLEERVEKIEESQEIIEEGLEEHKEIIEQLLEGGEGEETTFEDYMEENEEESDEDEEISSDEMGIDELLTASEEDKSMSLREQRKARLQKRAADNKETLADQWNLEQDKKKRSGPIQPEVSKGTIPKHEMPAIFKVSDLSLELTADKKAWLVLDKNDKPFCMLHKGSIPEEKFNSSDFARQVILDMHKMGIRQALKKYKAAKYVAKAPATPPVDKKMIEKTQAAANNDFKRRFLRAVRLALTAMNKNLVEDIPLKGAFYDILTSLDVPQTEKIIEVAFAKSGVAHFEKAIAQAEKYMDMSDAAFIEYEAQINGTKTASRTSVEDEEDMPQRIASREHALNMQKKAKENSLPFSSSSEEDPNDRMALLSKILPKPKLAHAASLFRGNRNS